MEHPTEAELLEARHLGFDTCGLDRETLQQLVSEAKTRHKVSNPRTDEYHHVTAIARSLKLDTPYGERLESRKARIEACIAAMLDEKTIQDGAYIRWADGEGMVGSTHVEWCGAVPYIVLLQGDPVAERRYLAIEIASYATVVA